MKKSFKVISLALVLTLILTALIGCSSQEVSEPASDTAENKSTDIVVIGSGGAGLSAAIEANDAGKEVIVVEKMPMVGGNTLRATGGLNAAGTSSQAAIGIEDSVASHYEDTMKGGYEKNDPELVEALTSQAAEAVEWLIELGADLSDVGRMAGASQNRSHRPTGGAPVGAHLVQVLKEAAEEKGIEILTETTALEILTEDGEIKGIIAKDKNNNEFTIEATAVIVATGGFGSNTTMITEYDAALDGFGTTNHPGATGDGISMAVAVGADLVDMVEIQTHPTVVPDNGYMITEAVRGNGAILINRDGQRFVNELGTRDVVSEATLEQEEQTAFLFFDEGIRESLSAIEGYIRQGFTTEADSIEELAEALGIDAENLTATVEAYNGYVAAGDDQDFGRDDMPRSLENSKFYAIEVGPAVHHTMGGLRINALGQVLDNEGTPISGLYAAGEVTGGVHGGNRLGGNALADLIVFGRLAGKSAGSDL
ncbi:fumarate reductase flavoprotein subunit [Clostridium aceticum]|uniref:Fumarate reductase flavoprotein subunit n=1 Tax=Clostridium aceticum TaxID=84022 RepID=A0A0D8IBB3_9CLOT|nr:flavocytochrome c [Clostridium aceticum]AKL96817.1 fumarate reductase flavoprotein subunit [Clostridium aceticum]KJF27568.1 fumarate reductase [Clostridium aceticum]